MNSSHLGVTKLSNIPNIKMLLLRAALKKSSYDPQGSSSVSLPNNKLHFEGIELDEIKYRSYHHVTGWQLESDTVHPCYLHSVAFPLHIMLLLQRKFPFPLLGLVHLDNQIRQMRPINKGEKLAVSSCFGQLELHPKGWLFSVEVEFYSGSELVWQSTSTNLFLTKHGYEVAPITKQLVDTCADPIKTNWELNANLGWRYAKVSGDFNPIHLTKWSAKLFGFKQHIIHGMWTKSYCISRLQEIAPSLFEQALEINTTFKQPLYLPSQVNMRVQPFESGSAHNGQQFKVLGIGANDEQQPLHLVGNICAI